MTFRLIAVLAASAFAAAAPAAAADVSCKETPAQLRTLAASAQPDQAAKALKLVATGEKLCAADGKYEAGKKFAAAAKTLGTELAALNTAATAQ